MKKSKFTKTATSAAMASILALCCMGSTVGADYGAIVSDESAKDEVEWVESADDVYSIIADKYSEQPYYSGCYFDDQTLCITVTEIQSAEKYFSELKDANLSEDFDKVDVRFDVAEYTYAQLSEAKYLLFENAEEYGISGTYTDPMKNCVVVESSFPAEEIYSLMVEKTGIENIIVDEVEEVYAEDESTYLRGGYAISNSTRSTSLSFGTAFKWNNTGTVGFLTAAHSTAQVGDVYKYNGTTIGTASSVQNSGSIDAALIQRTNSSYYGSSKVGTNGYVCTLNGSPITGETVYIFGQHTDGVGATILATDYNSTSMGMTDLIKTNCSSTVDGDSGGAYVSYRTTGNVFVGIHKGAITMSSGARYSIGIKWSNIKNAYGLTRVHTTEA